MGSRKGGYCRGAGWVLARSHGFWEVNVYRALTYFYPQHSKMSHTEFRQRLAWAFLTLGEHEYPDDAGAPSTTPCHKMPRSTPTPPAGPRASRCRLRMCMSAQASMRKGAYQYCKTCEEFGRGKIRVCGRKSGRDCMDQHASGKCPTHASRDGKPRSHWARSIVDSDED